MAAVVFVGAAPAAGMPKPPASVVVALPQLAPLAPETIPADAFAVLRDDVGVPFRFLKRDQLARFYLAVLSQNQQKQVSDLVVPEPPRFDACVRALRRGIDIGVDRSTTSDAARRRACRAAHEQATDAAAKQLLSLHWLVGEAGRHGIAFTESRIHRERTKIVHHQFYGERGYRRFLAQSGFNRADIRLNIIAQLAQTALVRQIQTDNADTDDPEANVVASEENQRAIDAFRGTFNAGWYARTACAPDFASLPACKSAPAG